MSARRIQIYPSAGLEKCLDEESKKRGIYVSALVQEILNKHYGLIPPYAKTDAEIEEQVFIELRDYVKRAAVGDGDVEFDLNKASDTYRELEMSYAGKPSILKANLGKKFAGMIGSGDFANVEQVRINGKLKRTVANRAAIYRIIPTSGAKGE